MRELSVITQKQLGLIDIKIPKSVNWNLNKKEKKQNIFTKIANNKQITDNIIEGSIDLRTIDNTTKTDLFEFCKFTDRIKEIEIVNL